MQYVLKVAVILGLLPVMGACSASSEFWDRSPRVAGASGRAADPAPYAAPQQQNPGPRAPVQSAPRYEPPASSCTPPPSDDPYSPFEGRTPERAPTPSRPGGAAAPPASGRTTTEDMAVLAEVNRIRTARGLRPLAYNAQLFVAARDHSLEQMRHGYMGHGSPDRSRDQLNERIALARYAGRAFAEVVAWGYRSVPAVVDGWMNSSSHRAILLDNDYTEAAFSRAGMYWTGNFGRPLGRSAARPAPRATPRATPRYAPRARPTPRTTPRPVPRARPAPTAPRPAPRARPAPTPLPQFIQPPQKQSLG